MNIRRRRLRRIWYRQGKSVFIACIPAILIAGFVSAAPPGMLSDFSNASAQLPVGKLPAVGANSVLGNPTGSSAAAVAMTMSGCSSTNSALKWTAGTGFGCNSTIDAFTLGSFSWGSPGALGTITPNSAKFTTVESSGASASYQFDDRNTSRAWQWYGASDAVRLYNGSIDILIIDPSGNADASGTVRTSHGYTVAGLPAAGTAGRRAYVTDQLTACPTLSSTFTGGGSVVCSAFDNGTNWVHE